jgi:hypothetical protein
VISVQVYPPPSATKVATGESSTQRKEPPIASPSRGTKKRPHSDAKDGEEDESMDAFISKFRKINGLFDKWMGWVSMKPNHDDTSRHATGCSQTPGNEILQWLNERGMLSE